MKLFDVPSENFSPQGFMRLMKDPQKRKTFWILLLIFVGFILLLISRFGGSLR